MRSPDDLIAEVLTDSDAYAALGTARWDQPIDTIAFVEVATLIDKNVMPTTRKEAFGSLNLPKRFQEFTQKGIQSTYADAFSQLANQLYFMHIFAEGQGFAKHDSILGEGLELAAHLTGIDMDRVSDEMLNEAVPHSQQQPDLYVTPNSRRVFLLRCLADMRTPFQKSNDQCMPTFETHTPNLFPIAERIRTQDMSRTWPKHITPTPEKLSQFFTALTGKYIR